MAKRLFDILFSGLALIFSAPLWVLAAIGIVISSPGPILYHATRIGRGGKPFRMVKFRTMTVGTAGQSEITSPGDSRIFPFGRTIRLLKIDELPQLLNILRGEMSIVGPRPESDIIVATHYSGWMRETLRVAPGLTSVGALFGYSYGEELIDPLRPEESYVERVLPAKLALERAYLERANILSDIACILRTAAAILIVPFGLKLAPARTDQRTAQRWVEAAVFPVAMSSQLKSFTRD
ncbi:sugar transferase [Altererythrobacter aquiaggeris]|uniref:sugar transferase n=1 Tax=Aestuarierythrobacter aquiaggeris TaxID=1898396 RepID=UPI003019107C